MVAFKFTGFNAGSAVALSASQGGVTDQASVPSWGTGLGSISITKLHSGEIVAPFGVILEASGHGGFGENGPEAGNVYDPTHDKYFYVWRLKTPDGLGGWVSQVRPPLNTAGVLNTPDVWRDMNVMYGPRTAFVIPHGPHRVELWCIELESGRTAEANWDVTVLDPDAIYTGARTAVFSSAGDFTGKPTGAVECTTEAQIQDFWDTQTQTGRVLFKRGEDTTFAGNIGFFTNGSGAKNFRVGTWGSGARPILRCSDLEPFTFGIFNSGTVTDMVIEGLDMRPSTWDASTESGKPGGAIKWSHFEAVNPYLVMVDSEVHGNLGVFTASTSQTTGRSIVWDSYIHDWGGGNARYGIFANGAYSVVAFSAIHDSPDACLGSRQNPFWNYGAAYRDNGRDGRTTVLAGSSFFCASGWSGDGNLAAAQPALRLNTSGDGSPRIVLDRVVAEGGHLCLDGAESGSVVGHPCNFLADKVLFVPDARSRSAVVDWNYNGTFRNCVGLFADTEYFDPPAVRTFFSFAPAPTSGDPEYLTAPCRHYSNTVLNQSGTVSVIPFLNQTSPSGGLDFANYSAENNVEEDPTGGQTADAPVNTSGGIAGFTPLSAAGIRWSVEKPSVVLGGNVSGSGGTVNVGYPDQHYVTSPGKVRTTRTTANTEYQSGNGHAVHNQTTGEYFYEEDGDISVSFASAGNAVVTNNSGTQWNNGAVLIVNLVLTSNQTDSFFATPAVLPLPVPGELSLARDPGTLGLKAHDDFLGNTRPADNGDKDKGAIEAT